MAMIISLLTTDNIRPFISKYRYLQYLDLLNIFLLIIPIAWLACYGNLNDLPN